VKAGDCTIAEAISRLKMLPFEEIDCATIDHHRALRQGFPEVIYGEGKTADEIISVVRRILNAGDNVLVTRINEIDAPKILSLFDEAQYHQRSRCLTIKQNSYKSATRGKILIVSAGTSDMPVAEEAFVTAEFLGQQVEQITDVGVAGIHRLLGQLERIMQASVCIVVAGMEGALPSVVGGLVDVPVIAVPTSVGYGANFGGLSALLGMLNSCASGVAVVNIDNGFGAAYMAAMINKKTMREIEQDQSCMVWGKTA
jgi:NCAIR mutase (PurE)-related protein